MSHLLEQVEFRRGKATSSGLATHDYDKDPAYCRSGVWWGIRMESSATVVYTCPAGPPTDNFPNGVMLMAIDGHLLYPDLDGNGTGVEPPPGTVRAVPNRPGLTYSVTRTGSKYRIALTIAAGADQIECTLVAALSPCNEPDSVTVKMSGALVAWDRQFLEAERRCHAVIDELRPHVPVFGRPGPPGPVERWLASVRGDEVRTVHALVDALTDQQGGDEQRGYALSRLAGMYLSGTERLGRTTDTTETVESEPEGS